MSGWREFFDAMAEASVSTNARDPKSIVSPIVYIAAIVSPLGNRLKVGY